MNSKSIFPGKPVFRAVNTDILVCLYIVMLSDGNSFSGDAVLDKTSRDEDNILNQIYKSKYVRISIMMILIL